MRAQSAALSKLSACVVTCVTIYARTAASDTDPVAKANNLFEAGQSLLAAGKIHLACDAFAESQLPLPMKKRSTEDLCERNPLRCRN